MKVSPFEMDAGPAEPRPPAHADAPPSTAMSARRGDDEDQDRDETIEEPGYGHGV